MMWDGKERRGEDRDSDHDILTRIHADLSNFMIRFEEHTIKDEKSFEKIDGRTSRLEKFFYALTGAFFLFQVIMKLNGK